MNNLSPDHGQAIEPTNAALAAMLQEQGDVISMMQIQLDMQKEEIGKQQEQIHVLQSQVAALKEATCSSKDNVRTTSSATVERDWKPESPRPEDASVADLVKEVAQEVLAQQTDYIYDEKTGLYYDQNSGYYYDPVQELFYNGHTRTYYRLDAETNTYVFHSKLPDAKEKKKKKSSRKIKKIKVEPYPEDENAKTSPTQSPMRSAEMEDGELSESEGASSGKSDEGTDSDSTITSHHSTSTGSSRIKDEVLPCIRAVVMESSVRALSKGFLFLVTVMGGSVGREGSTHSILIPDPHVSKHHADIHYSVEEGKFYLTDMGSQSGTFLNGRRLSDSRVTSQSVEVLHGSTIKIGATTLLIHIHPGLLTCAMCEPGLNAPAKEPLYGPAITKETKEAVRKKEMKKLRKKYGIEQGVAAGNLPETYTDRASERRKVKGSDNPYEKTEVASVNENIKESNKGFKMLSKMGWKSGTSLGRPAVQATSTTTVSGESQGITEPIKVEILPQRVGLGYQQEQQHVPLNKSVPPRGKEFRQGDGRMKIIMEKTLKRYHEGVNVPDFNAADECDEDASFSKSNGKQ